MRAASLELLCEKKKFGVCFVFVCVCLVFVLCLFVSLVFVLVFSPIHFSFIHSPLASLSFDEHWLV